MNRKLALAVALLLPLAACSPTPASSNSTVTVFAAASLKDSFPEIGKAFTAKNPGVTVEFSFAGSSSLVDQIQGGAPADVFASADEKNMKRAADAKLVSGTPKLFATNTLTLAVAPGNPLNITGFDSLSGKKLVICAEGVPCGNATKKLAEANGVHLTPVSTEQSVTDVLGKVTSGEADAGIVYQTDAKAAEGKATAVELQGADKVVNRYPIAVTASTKNAQAQPFVDFVTSDAGLTILAKYGFGRP